MTATAGQLKRYGYPQRPTNPTALAGWKYNMAHATHYVYPASESKVTPTTPSTTGTWAYYTDVVPGNWAGYAALANQNGSYPYLHIFDVAANMIVRQASTAISGPCVGKRFGGWVGIGGEKGIESDLNQGGFASVDANPPSYYMWWEDVGYYSTSYPVSEVPVKPGDTIYVEVHELDTSG